MNRNLRTTLLALSLCALAAGPLGGQQPDPFGADPFGGGRPAPPAGGAPAPAAPAAIPRDNPAVVALYESNPQTPAELLNAGRLLLDLGYPELARGMVVRANGANLQPAQLVDLHNRLGSALFIRLLHEADLHPEGLELARATLAAAEQAAKDPARLEALVRELSHENPTKRQFAISDLRNAGKEAIAPILAALGDPARAAEAPYLRSALVRMADVSADPLLGAMGTPNETLRVQVIGALGDLYESRAVPLLVYPCVSEEASPAERTAAELALRQIVGRVPDRAAARRLLMTHLKDYLAGRYAGTPDNEGLVEVWMWDPQTPRSRTVLLPVREASLLAAGRMAEDLIRREPNDLPAKRLYLLATLAGAKLFYGIDRPLPPPGPNSPRNAAAAQGAEALEDALNYALDHGLNSAAIAAAEVLGDVGTPELLHAPDGHARPLARAMQHRDRRVRFAAANAVMRIDPHESYLGASHLTEVAGYLIRTEAAPRVLVGHPNRDAAQTLAGMLMEMGYEAETAVTGRELFRRAVASPDFEAIFISDAIDFPDARELLQWIRRDLRTATIPIGLEVRGEYLEEFRRLAGEYSLTEAFPRAHQPDTLGYQLQVLRGLSESVAVATPERVFQARTALAWLRKLSEESDLYSFYDLRREEEAILSALANPVFTQEAAPIAGTLGTPRLQRALVVLIGQHTRSIDDRRAMAEAFAAAVRRRGLRLNRDEIHELYDRYNISLHLDDDTLAVLSSLLDVIEEPRNQWNAAEELGEARAAAAP